MSVADMFPREEAKALRLSFRFDVLYSCNMFVFEFYGSYFFLCLSILA